MPKNRVAFFDIDGTIRNKSLTESLFEILVRYYKYRGKDFNKYFELQSEISSLRKAYKSSEDRADDLFGEYCQKVVKFAMFALKNYTIEEVREIGRRVSRPSGLCIFERAYKVFATRRFRISCNFWLTKIFS